MNEELKTYWQYLRDNNADVPDTFESFHSTLQDDVSAHKYYDYLKAEGFDAPDTFESFANTLGLKKKGIGSPTPTPILGQEQVTGPKDFLASLQYQPSDSEAVQENQLSPEAVAVGPVVPLPTDNSEQKAEQFLASADLQDQIEQGRLAQEFERQSGVKPQTDFGTMNLDQIDDELAKKSPRVFNEPSVTPGSTDIQNQLKVPVSQIDLDVNKFEAKKDKLRDLGVKADKAKYAEELQKFSDTAIKKIDKQLEKLPSNLSFEDTGTGGVSSPRNEERDILEMAKSILEEVKDTPDQGGFFEGLASKGFVGVLPFVSGLEELPKLRKLRDVSLEAQPGDKENELKAYLGEEVVDKLDPNKRQLLSAEAIRQEFNRAKENPNMYRFGRVLAEMIPYMGEYVALAGTYTAARTTVVKGLETALKGAAKKTIIRNGVIKPISTLVGVASQTAANPTRIAATTMERMTPQLKATLALDPNELKGVVGEDGEKFTEAFTKAFGVNAMELLTERFGQWSSEAGDAIKAAGYWLPNVTLGRWMAKRGFVNLSEANKAAKALGWDGIFKEIYVEEFPNKLLQEAITGDENILSDLAKDGPPTKETIEFFNPLSDEFLDMVFPSLLISGGPMAYGAFKKWATKPDPTVMEEVLKKGGSVEDVEALTEKIKGTKTTPSEKPKEPTPSGGSTQVPEVKAEESVPVQGEQEKQSKERKKVLINTLLDTDDVDHSFKTAGYTNKEGFWVEPGAENQFGQLSQETKDILKKNGIVFIGNAGRADIAGAAGGLKVYENGKSKVIRGIHLTDHGENYAGHDKVAVHEAAHSVWSDLDKATQDLFNDGNPITDHGKEYKKVDERYKAVYGENQDQLGEEDFAELFALNRGDLEKTISDKKKQSEQVAPETKVEAKVELVTQDVTPEIVTTKPNKSAIEIKPPIRISDVKGEYIKPFDGFESTEDVLDLQKGDKVIFENNGKFYIGELEQNAWESSDKPVGEIRKRGFTVNVIPRIRVAGLSKRMNEIYPIERAEEFGITTEQKTKESKAQADKIAQDSGFDNASHLINSVKKRTGKEYENVQEIPQEVINRVANERNIEKLPPAKEVNYQVERYGNGYAVRSKDNDILVTGKLKTKAEAQKWADDLNNQVKPEEEKSPYRTPEQIEKIASIHITNDKRDQTVKVRSISNGKEALVVMNAEEALLNFRNRAGIKKAKDGNTAMEDLIDCLKGK